MSNGRPPIGAPPRPAVIREEIPARSGYREEIPIPVERNAYREEIPMPADHGGYREEIPIPVERPSRNAYREEIPAGAYGHDAQPAYARQVTPAHAAPAQPAAPAMTREMLQALVSQIETRVRGQVEAQVEARLLAHQSKPARAAPETQESIAALKSELDALRAKVASQPAAQAAVAQLPPDAAKRIETLTAEVEALRAQLASQPVAAAAPAAGEGGAKAKANIPTTAPGTPGKNRIDRFLKLMSDRGASDLHISVGRPPIFRLGGRMEPIRYRTLDDVDYRALLEPITPQHIWADYVELGDADFAYELPGVCRFRVNMFKQERGMGAVFRVIPTKLLTVQQLGLPDVIRKVVNLRSGLVLVTGPTGSGKSTTLSAIINEMNETRPMHFVTIEDPIEFVHPNKKSLMSQREIGPHSKSFSTALRAAVREDPDAILVGEMRDLETIAMALNAAETGVLVFGTLHTNSAAKTIDRIINVFPADKQSGVRGTLASVIKCVVAQQLLRKKGGGRAAAVEIMFSSNAMASMIREGKTHQISGLIKLGKRDGMIAMDDALKKLIEEDKIEPIAGLEKSIDKDDFRKWLKDRGDAVPEDAGGH